MWVVYTNCALLGQRCHISVIIICLKDLLKVVENNECIWSHTVQKARSILETNTSNVRGGVFLKTERFHKGER